ncbi:MAG: tryptophan synthase subunit alpha, partial [Staphylococcus simulans]|nr:tryptophan synthase subunit alpha [Staphylococcus simulans]
MSKLFIPYIMGNKKFIDNLKVLQEEGADIVEIG